jgi:tellurite resistance protein TehA-like permease
VWLLPIVAPEVAASTAGALAPHLAAEAAQQLLVAGFVLWGLSLSLAFSLITLVLLRLALHKLPDTDFAATSWLPLGPLATGCLGLLSMGQAAPLAFAGTPLVSAAELARDLGLIGGLALWGAGLWWLVIATLFTRHYIRDNMPFNLGWWGFTFPLGVFALATFELQAVTGLSFFAFIGLLLAVQLAAVWTLVFSRTLAGVWHGELFQAPCLGGPGSPAVSVLSEQAG